jgi:hypothetical protein
LTLADESFPMTRAIPPRNLSHESLWDVGA